MNYIAYHKVEKMGETLALGPPFSIFTKRPSRHLIGQDIWLIEGINRNYYVRQHFRIDEVVSLTNGEFRFECVGKSGCNIETDKSLRDYYWFSDFMKSVGNFGIGIVPVQEEFLCHFKEMLNISLSDNANINSDLPAQRVSKTINGIKRDTTLARRVKQIHDYQCQICKHTITLPDGSRYAEAHHIKPLGTPHNGPDIASNLICVCPNHHVELDYFAKPLNVDDIHSSNGHVLDQDFIDYHNDFVHRG